MHRWDDPSAGKSAHTQGPYLCTKRYGHRPPHGIDTPTACALWESDGKLLMTITFRIGWTTIAASDAEEESRAL